MEDDKMGIEYECEIPIRKTVMIPIAGMVEHYKKQGYTIKTVQIEQHFIADYISGDIEHKKEIRAKYPTAIIIKRTDGSYFWSIPNKVPSGLLIELEAIKQLPKERIK